MQPDINAVHADQRLTNFSTKIAPDIKNCVWRAIAPVIGVDKKSDTYWTFNQGDQFRINAQVIADGDAPPITGYRLSNDSFACEQYSQGTNLTWAQDKNADAILRMRYNKTTFVTAQTELKIEKDLADAIDTTGVAGTDVTGGSDFTQWNDFDSSTPIDDMQDGIDAIVGASGIFPNVARFGYQTWSKLARNPEVMGVLGAHERAIVTPDLLAEALRLDKIVICQAIYNSTDANQTASYSYIWGKNAHLMYVDPNPGPETATALHTFEWQPFKVRTVPIELNKTDVIERWGWYDQKVVGSNLMYYFYNAVA